MRASLFNIKRVVVSNSIKRAYLHTSRLKLLNELRTLYLELNLDTFIIDYVGCESDSENKGHTPARRTMPTSHHICCIYVVPTTLRFI